MREDHDVRDFIVKLESTAESDHQHEKDGNGVLLQGDVIVVSAVCPEANQNTVLVCVCVCVVCARVLKVSSVMMCVCVCISVSSVHFV